MDGAAFIQREACRYSLGGILVGTRSIALAMSSMLMPMLRRGEGKEWGVDAVIYYPERILSPPCSWLLLIVFSGWGALFPPLRQEVGVRREKKVITM